MPRGRRRKCPRLYTFKIREITNYTGTLDDSFNLNLLGYDRKSPVLTIIKAENEISHDVNVPSGEVDDAMSPKRLHRRVPNHETVDDERVGCCDSRPTIRKRLGSHIPHNETADSDSSTSGKRLCLRIPHNETAETEQLVSGDSTSEKTLTNDWDTSYNETVEVERLSPTDSGPMNTKLFSQHIPRNKIRKTTAASGDNGPKVILLCQPIPNNDTVEKEKVALEYTKSYSQILCTQAQIPKNKNNKTKINKWKGSNLKTYQRLTPVQERLSDHTYTNISGPSPLKGRSSFTPMPLPPISITRSVSPSEYIIEEQNVVDLCNDTDENDVQKIDKETNTDTAMFSEYINTLICGKKIVNTSKSEAWRICLFDDLKHCNQLDFNGNFPIHTAVSTNNLKLVTRQCLALRVRCGSINWYNQQLLTPLQLAILRNCSFEIISILIQYNADNTVIDRDGNTILHLAALNLCETSFKSLLTKTVLNLNAMNHDGDTPLLLCVTNKKHAHAEMLLAAGADPNQADKRSGRTPLYNAVVDDDLPMVMILFDYNALTRVPNFFGQSAHDIVYELDISADTKNAVLKTSRLQDKKFPKSRISFVEAIL